MRANLKITIVHADVREFAVNVLILKYAQAWHGADLAVAKELGLGRGWDVGGDFVKAGQYRIVDGESKVKAEHVLFEGVQPLRDLTYSGIRAFARSALQHVHTEHPDIRHLAMTMHGVAFGLDERESFLSQIAGIVDALSKPDLLPNLEEISIVERVQSRAKRLDEYLKENYFPGAKVEAKQVSSSVTEAGATNKEREHVFVAMPFSEEMEDVFIFGIQGPVQESGLLCERVDQAVFTGDIVERIKNRIATAKLVIADLSGANANVYLEVGYAWGKNVNTLLLCRNVDELKFDVKSHRCLVYSSINDLRKKLLAELKVLTN